MSRACRGRAFFFFQKEEGVSWHWWTQCAVETGSLGALVQKHPWHGHSQDGCKRSSNVVFVDEKDTGEKKCMVDFER